MPHQTRETELPKPPAAPIDWKTIASSGRVWDFVEGQDFTGKAASYRARLKTAARKDGVDFDSREVQKNGKTILKIKASALTQTKRAPVKRERDTGIQQLDFGQLPLGGDSST